MLPRDTSTLPDDNIQIAGSSEFCAFWTRDAPRQMGEERPCDPWASTKGLRTLPRLSGTLLVDPTGLAGRAIPLDTARIRV
jgi:hypothetical protein